MKKTVRSKRVRMVLVLALVVALALPVLASAATAYVNTKTDRLNLREGPGFQYRIIYSFPRGTKVEVLSVRDGWAYVLVDGRYGYMYEGYLSSVHPDRLTKVTEVYEWEEPETQSTPTPAPTPQPTPEPPEEEPAGGDKNDDALPLSVL